MKEERAKLKICLVGDKAVGKTSIIRRYVLDQFDDRYLQTLGAKVSKKTMDLTLALRNLRVKVDLSIWDIMGEKSLADLLREAYLYGVQGILAVCDVTRRSTLAGLGNWLDGVFLSSGNVPVHILINKSDLREDFEIAEEEINKVGRSYDSPYLFTSAKTGDNVDVAFEQLTRRIIERKLGPHIDFLIEEKL